VQVRKAKLVGAKKGVEGRGHIKLGQLNGKQKVMGGLRTKFSATKKTTGDLENLVKDTVLLNRYTKGKRGGKSNGTEKKNID